MAPTLTIAVHSPGAMGSALGRAWRAAGARVVATVEGRSARTRELADGLELLPALDDVVAVADIVVSIGPPGQAIDMAEQIAAACRTVGRQPLVADLNAIAPATARRIEQLLDAVSCQMLDGSISGGPPNPSRAHPTRLYLSGPSAQRLADIQAPGLVTQVVGTQIGLASAVKMSTAAVYKGFSALLLQSLQTANANGVLAPVLADLGSDLGDLIAGAATDIAVAAAKANRYPGEMREIATAQGDAGAEPALYAAMALVYESVARTALGAHSPEQAANMSDLDTVLSELGQPAPSRP